MFLLLYISTSLINFHLNINELVVVCVEINYWFLLIDYASTDKDESEFNIF